MKTNSKIRVEYIDETGASRVVSGEYTNNAFQKVVKADGSKVALRKMRTSDFIAACRNKNVQVVKIMNVISKHVYYERPEATAEIPTDEEVAEAAKAAKAAAEKIAAAAEKIAEKIAETATVEEFTEAAIELPELEIKVETPKVESNGNGGMKQLAKMIEPHLENMPNVDYNQVGEIIKDQLRDHTKTIKIVYPDDQPTKDMGKQHQVFPQLLKLVEMRNLLVKSPMLIGPSGSGKTTGAIKVAEALNLPFFSISVNMMSTKTDFMGYTDANGKYVRTQFRDAYENGGVFMLDELDAGHPNVMTTINMATANGHANFPDMMVARHKDFVLIAGANTYGKGANREYVGRNQLDDATLDRFMPLSWDYDEEFEISISPNESWTKYCQALRANADKYKVRHIISPRASITGGHLLNVGAKLKFIQDSVLGFSSLQAADIDKLTKDVVGNFIKSNK